MVKIAVASTDGKLINQHFGKADTFYILEIGDKNVKYKVAEIRKTKPVCAGGDHGEDDLAETVAKLADCSIVLVSRIGMRARIELETSGIEVFEAPGVIEEAVDGLLRIRRAR